MLKELREDMEKRRQQCVKKKKKKGNITRWKAKKQKEILQQKSTIIEI